MANTVFQRGDVVSIEATLSSLCCDDVVISVPGYFGETKVTVLKDKLTLVKRPAPPKPAPGSLVESNGLRYLVDDKGGMRYINSVSGITYDYADEMWDDHDHAKFPVKVLA